MESIEHGMTSSRQSLLRNTFFLGVVLSACFAIADSLLTNAGIARGLGRLAFFGAIDAGVLWLLAESWRPTLRTLAMFVGGGVLGAGYFVANYAHEQIHISGAGAFDYVYYFAYAVLIAPIFEEAVVRRLMFFGAAEWVGWSAAAVSVSALFALAHANMWVFAFMFSLLMCLMAYRGVKTIDRAVFHGSHNLILQGLLVYYGT